ncbi:MAG: NADH-quinone oxidoreductase subunit J family protein [Carbonactinosporaceae bacterium]
MTGVEILFGCVGLVALGSAVLVVTSHNLVHAALWLVVTLGALAGCFLLLTAEFVAWVQVLIYVGAIVVLLLFGLMLTRAPIGYSADLDSGNRPAATLVAAGTAATLVTVVVDAFGRAYLDLDGGAGPRAPGSGEAIGAAVFRYWVLPFEVLSVLLLASLVGAIVLSRARGSARGDSASATADEGTGP